ncbi:conserved hypothetical protein [Levilactobacillus brevis KB290]|uniref:Uncharacterized protein n=2 Tax=Levilactobacillus brevis TaxID=1580 RepID=M5AY91_LEVBR|nr:conserved hypothetical protein [Levilactobacillus brevis KB290]
MGGSEMTPTAFNTGRVQVNKTIAELRSLGKDARERVPFSQLGQYQPLDRDSNQLMDRIRRLLIPELLPERTRRMAASPFAFFSRNCGVNGSRSPAAAQFYD